MLRPQFTRTLAHTLRRESVNVHGEAGQGQSRLVADLGQLMRQSGWMVLSIDLNSWKEDYHGMVGELSKQVRAEFVTVTKSTKGFGTLIATLDKHAGQTPVLLVLENFDALLNNALHLDSNYAQFIDHLNSLRNQENHRLLVMTGDHYLEYRVYADKIRDLSLLHLTPFELETLSYSDILVELQRHATQLNHDDLALLTRTIYAHQRAFEFLEHCTTQLAQGNKQELPLARRLKIWDKRFNHYQKRSIRKNFDQLLNWFAIMGREAANWSLQSKLLRISVFGLITTILIFFDKIKPFVASIKGWFK